MIQHWLIRGDCHGNINWIKNLSSRFSSFKPTSTGVIILGDTGINFYLDERDIFKKEILNQSEYAYYLVRGNHEQRPELLKDIISIFDENVDGEIYVEPKFTNIRYLKDGGKYVINNLSVLTIGGAYSIDKDYRLKRYGLDVDAPEEACVKAGWFPQEQLTNIERDVILNKVKGLNFDLILTHTCPLQWEPHDLFMTEINQALVDKTMEKFLDKIVQICQWRIWLFGHYHADRIERPYVQQLYNNIEDINTIWNMWKNYKYLNKG